MRKPVLVVGLVCLAIRTPVPVARVTNTSTVVSSSIVNASTSAQELASKLKDYFGRLSDFGFSGAALVAKDDQIIFENAYGYANLGNHIPNTVETVFPVGSITKQFTGAAILKLEMDHKLSTGDLLSKYIPNIPSDKASITLHHLLTHTAGLQEDYADDYERISREAYIDRIMNAKLKSTPGERYSYSNAGYSLLAAVIEIVTGTTWEHYVHDNLFVPAGMLHTGCIIPDRRHDVVAHGYAGDKDWGTFLDRFGPESPFWNQRGNGGILSTVEDMYKWHVALEGNKILSTEAKTKYYTPWVLDTPGSPPVYYAYGWTVRTTSRGTKLIGHNGGNGIFSAEFLRFVDDHVVVYIATNWSQMLSWQMVPAVVAILFGGDYVVPPSILHSSPEQLTKYDGIYALPGSTSALIISAEGDHLDVSGDGQDAINLLDPLATKYDERFTTLNSRTQQILSEHEKGHDEPLVESFGGGQPKEQVEAMLQSSWKHLGDELGAVKKNHVLGTLHGPEGGAITAVQQIRERGTAYLSFYWNSDGTVDGFESSHARKNLRFYREPSDGVVSFDLDSAEVVRMKPIGPAAAVTKLKISNSRDSVVASRAALKADK